MRGCFYNTIKKEIFFKINILVNTYTYYFGFIIALKVSGCSIPLVNNVSIKLNLVDKPEKRKQHKKNIVRLGGLSILLGIYVSIIILMRFNFLIFPKESLIWPIFNFAPLFFLGLQEISWHLHPAIFHYNYLKKIKLYLKNLWFL